MQFGSYEVLQKAVEQTRTNSIPYAEPTDVYDFAKNSNIIRQLTYENGDIYGYSVNATGTTQLVPEVSTSTLSTTTNNMLTLNEAGTQFEGLNEVVSTYVGHSVLGSLSILSDISAISNSLGINCEELAQGHDPLWLQNLADDNPDLWRFLKTSTIDNIKGVPMIHDVTTGISYINEDGVSLAIELLNAQGLQKSRTDPSIPNIVAVPYANTNNYTYVKNVGSADEITITNLVLPAGAKAVTFLDPNDGVYKTGFSCDRDITNEYYTFNETQYGVTEEKRVRAVCTSYTYNGKTVYIGNIADANGVNATSNAPESTVGATLDIRTVFWLALYGLMSYPEGYSAKTGANTIDITGYKGLSAKEKMTLLGHDYPAWIANKLSTRTVDADGNVKNYDWLPVQLATGFNNGIIGDTFNTDGTQTDDGSYPTPEMQKLALDIPILDGINGFRSPKPEPNPTVTPTPDNPIPKQPVDNGGDGFSQGAHIGAGAVPIGDVPTIGAKVYIPSRDNLNELMSFLWSGLFDLDTFKKLFQDPMEAIVGLQQVYFEPRIDGHDEIILGNVRTGVDNTPYTMKRFYRLDCGSVSLPEYFGNVFDYETELKLYLPFVGIVPISTDECMRAASIKVVYDLDILSGGGNAKVLVNRDGNQVMIGTYGCQTASQYPISGSNHMASVNTILGLSASAIGAAAGGVGGALTGSALAKGASRLVGSAGGIQSHIQQSGGYMGNGGLIHKTPYLIIERPIPNMPADYNEFDGYPYYKSTTLGNCVGMTKCGEVHLDVTGISSLEKDMIISELQKGVIL